MNAKRLVVVLMCMMFVAFGLVSCSRARSDAAITSDVETKIHADATLAAAPITIQSNSGVVVLSGSVETDAGRSSAENAAKQVDGVKGVVNNLQVMTAAVTPPLAKAAGEKQVPNPRPSGAKTTRPVKAASPVGSALPASQQAQAAVPQPSQSAPEPVRVTLPEGTAITVRLIDPVDSEKNKEGDRFSASLDSPIVIDDKTVIPKNADVEARLVSAKSAGHFTGSSAVVLVLSKITFGGKSYDVQTGEFTKQGASRGKRSAVVIGGGAAVGAVIGAIAGGGKGAAIGAAAGAGTGTGVQALTKSEQIKLPAETLLEFQLKAPLTVTPAADTAKREKVG